MSRFVWDARKEIVNLVKHGVDFSTARKAFLDPHRRIFTDEAHGEKEERYFCLGKVEGRVLTVRFVRRGEEIRIFGAGYWRKGRRYYEKEEAGQ